VTATGPGDDDRIIDIRRLREFAVHGIPASVREEVWLYFLGVLPAGNATLEMSSSCPILIFAACNNLQVCVLLAF
jgi:hypothetical protein